MKRMVCIFVCIWVLGIAGLQGQTPEAALAAAEARFKALTSFSATVGYVMGEERDMGKVYYRGNQYQLDFPEDFTVCDGKVTMTWSKAFGQISYPEEGDGPDLSVAGVYSAYRFPYTITWIDSTTLIQRIRLTPREQGSSLAPITIGLHRHTGFIDSYTVQVREDFVMEMMILDYKLNPVLDDKLFVIDWAFVKRVEDGEVPPVEHHHK